MPRRGNKDNNPLFDEDSLIDFLKFEYGTTNYRLLKKIARETNDKWLLRNVLLIKRKRRLTS